MTESCGKSCYNAKGSVCDCWCKGTFHGARGAMNRRLALFHFGKLPATPEEGYWMQWLIATRPNPRALVHAKGEKVTTRLLNA